MIMKIIISLLGLTYVLSPYDLIPDFFGGIGWIDDIIALILVWKLFQYYSRMHASKFRENDHTSYRGTNNERFSGNEAFGAGRDSGGEIRNDPYEVLGVAKNASLDEIKKAYKGLAAKYHPDKVTHLGEEFRVLAEQRFKEIQDAYQELTVK